MSALLRGWFVFSVVLGANATLVAQEKKKTPPKLNDLADYRTVETAVTAKITKTATASGLPGYLGIAVIQDNQGRVIVANLQPDSPAAKAGLQEGDTLQEIGGRVVKNTAVFRELLLAHAPGEVVPLQLVRNGAEVTLKATLGVNSRPMKLGGQRGVIGVQVGETPEGDGVALKSITTGMPADKAGLKIGEVILKVDGQSISTPNGLTDAVAGKQPGDSVTLSLRRDGKNQDLKITLAADKVFESKIGSWDNRALSAWKKSVYRLAVVPIEYADVKHNPQITQHDWENSLFSTKSYKDKSATGQRVYGSLNDYYLEQSFGNLRVEGKVFQFIEASKKRADYGQANTGPGKTALLSEALDLLLKRDGKDALKDFDGIFFLYAGGRVQTNRGSLYWPHRATFSHQGKRWPYFISSEGGGAMSTISVICHEFGHMLGLPDLYARPEQPGSEGAGVWCAMSNQIGNGRPQHFCAWSKEQLGWIKPTIIDPSVKQKLILSPVENSPKECFKVLAKLDGSEYFLLENRRKKGFDYDLPAEGLLIWRVVQGKPILEEAHGVDGPAGPRVFLNAVPFPSPANNAFTPFTIPSSRTQLGGGVPVWITNIRSLPDGRIAFWIGYEFF